MTNRLNPPKFVLTARTPTGDIVELIVDENGCLLVSPTGTVYVNVINPSIPVTLSGDPITVITQEGDTFLHQLDHFHDMQRELSTIRRLLELLVDEELEPEEP